MEGDENMKLNRKESLHMHGRQTDTRLKAEYLGGSWREYPKEGGKPRHRCKDR
jgi:hypothetical protein